MSRTAGFLFCLLVIAVASRAADVFKTDGSQLNGASVSFDGQTLQVHPLNANEPEVAVSLRDIARIQFHETGRSVPVKLAPDSPLPDHWQIKLTNGDLVSGPLQGWKESELEVRFQLDPTVALIPLTSVHEIWRDVPDLVRRAHDLKVSQGLEDVVYVLKDGDIISVKGLALGLEGASLGFVYEGQHRTIKLNRIVGVTLAAQKRSPASRPSSVESGVMKLSLLSGDVLTGRMTELKDLAMTFQTSWGQTVRFRTNGVADLEVVSPNAVYLSSLKPVRVEQTPYFDRVIPWRADASLEGGPLQLNDGHTYSHGVAMHSRCVLEYALDGAFDQFTARLGFEPLPGGASPGRVAVRVTCDGAARFDESDFRSDRKPRDLAIDTRNAKRLVLEVDFGADQDVNDRVVWANAQLIRAAGKP